MQITEDLSNLDQNLLDLCILVKGQILSMSIPLQKTCNYMQRWAFTPCCNTWLTIIETMVSTAKLQITCQEYVWHQTCFHSHILRKSENKTGNMYPNVVYIYFPKVIQFSITYWSWCPLTADTFLFYISACQKYRACFTGIVMPHPVCLSCN